MSSWGSAATESGILRKNRPLKDNHDDLLVFGYACKLFRDDDKAQYIDQGKHLIPWMGDDKLKIDRYDGRGALPDVALFEASREGYDVMRWLGLSYSDRKLEMMCDKERYHSLHTNEEEEQMYKEEEEKRRTSDGNQVPYSYEVEGPMIGPAVAPEEGSEDGEEEEEYRPLASLDVPVDVEIPRTVKENARIEKTAQFVCRQGPQMEILIKAKQADKPQFGFLNQGHPLYKYYRHVLSAIKNGRYQGVTTTDTEKSGNEVTDSQVTETSDDHYLHPSLVATATLQQDATATTTTGTGTASTATVSGGGGVAPPTYRPSADCAYSQLVNRIQGGQSAVAKVEASAINPREAYARMSQQEQQYYQYYYSVQYYEYYKQMAQYQQQAPSDDASVQNYIHQMAYAQYLQNHPQQPTVPPTPDTTTTNPYAQIVSNVKISTAESVNPYPIAAEPAKPPPNDSSTPKVTPAVSAVTVKKPLLSLLAQYGSGSEDDNSDDDEQDEVEEPPVKEPTGETRIVIDKMAVYVSKNGDQFEEIVRAKADPRFDFLNVTHDYYPYYRQKIKQLKDPNGEAKPKGVDKTKKKVVTPVCFSIKKVDEPPKKEIVKSALPVEESSGDEGGEATPSPSQATPTPEEAPPPPATPPSNSNNNNNNGNLIDSDDPLLEKIIDLSSPDDVDSLTVDGDLDDKLQARRAEEKIRDKLALAAREKVFSSAARDRALQLERKRKAAAFLKLKSAEQLQVVTVSAPKVEVVEGLETTPPSLQSRLSEGEEGGKVGENGGVKEKEKEREKKRKSSSPTGVTEEVKKKTKESSKRKKTHKRKHARSKHESSRSGSSKRKKSSKKRRHKSDSDSSESS